MSGVNLRRWNIVLHRDIGYFLSGLVVIYCLSGIALNHVDDWNPDFIITKRSVPIPERIVVDDTGAETLAQLNALVGESRQTVHDTPAPGHLKLYYDNATFHIDLRTREGRYERIERRPVFYESNLLHRNTVRGWKWVSDIFGVLLIFLSISGWFMLKGANGLSGRGKWFIAAGMLPPVAALFLFSMMQ